MIEIPRRKLFTTAAAFFCAPAIVRADSLMKMTRRKSVRIGYDITYVSWDLARNGGDKTCVVWLTRNASGVDVIAINVF